MGIPLPNAGKNGAQEHWVWIEHLKEKQNVEGVGVGRNININQSKTCKKPNPLDLDHRASFLCYYNRSEYCPI